MQLIEANCTGCGYCVLVCPYDALEHDGSVEVIQANCTDCNLCFYACPSDCFVPDRPLKPYRPRLKEAYDVVIIGSGLGGLMAGAALAQAGRRVAVFEKLGFPGGRYTELDYRGAAVTTGAWTNLGPKSHIGRFLAGLGLELAYISLADAGLTEQYAIRFLDGRHYASLFDMLSPAARRAWLRAVAQGRRQPPEDISAAAYLDQFTTDPDLLAVVDAIAATASGLSSTALPASEYIQITLDGQAAGRDFAMPAGGVRAIIRTLTGALRRAGGELFLRSPVTRILVEPDPFAGGGYAAVGLELAGGRQVRSRVVLHNGGPRRLLDLIGPDHLPVDYVARLRALVGVECAALFCATREPLFNGAPMLMTPNCRRVVGIFAPTNLDPTLSKTGLHLADAFFPLRGHDRRAELAQALADLRDLFPHFDRIVEWNVPMFFTGSWPGTESGQTFGQTGDHRLDPATPLKNCLLVGMDGQGSGVAGDLIPLGVQRVLAYLKP